MDRHHEGTALIAAAPEEVFAFIDDHSRFASHMSGSSWMMGGGRMVMEVDAAKGQAVGSHIRLTGRAFGFRLLLDEVVTRRTPPAVKLWETVGSPKLLVIGTYRVGAEIWPASQGSRVRVFIDYDLPTGPTLVLGWLFGALYAKWCVKQMLAGASDHFRRRGPLSPFGEASHAPLGRRERD